MNLTRRLTKEQTRQKIKTKTSIQSQLEVVILRLYTLGLRQQTFLISVAATEIVYLEPHRWNIVLDSAAFRGND
jgi:hypothetical protein